MALTRKFLAALGIEPEKIDEIITAHTEVTDALKAERDSFKEEAEKVAGLQAQVTELQGIKESADKDPFKVKYDALKEDFEKYKSGIESEKLQAKKTAAYRKLLADAGVSEKRIDSVLRVSDTSKVELDEDGHIKDGDTLSANIKKEWADFIATPAVVGAQTATPPTHSTGGMTKEQIEKIKDPVKRQKAMFENKELYGL